ncbi:ABC transporter ATP-binding protein [Fusobacterium polymorphum]|jgi:oligopeptide ABC superfamily ATP binding cassette transporter, ABC protein|uniref:ABC transporter ATP-binding protein n=1 Tax=Fusobacterium nucleatum subsp. polymorphum TaxID=76857 RepID=A0A1Z3CE27_FUSNP|nr:MULTISPECIES: dipeptide/oligopeptide/nickel ABC transporter ATP-binding protein [Fusobacterium]BEO97389.1 dipeptide/oligopeptide/nickel ABC transporter ATP-binding protein [Fusobacterium nucleatum]ASC01854.1 ABC transporter ATP-binding protein [Fusobacterium polymorphum]OFO31322.1 peptide ABC transporter substrate-binding protein [Fusobacterium sp. HMSC064B11]PHI16966.1 ABC transporter ATP-binding protein [Fusobacterium polymorphum]BEP07403.1 dipeptide/oligopeptide/nickel ABC transporter AT
MKEILSVKNLNKSFESGFKLKNINFDIKEGEVVSLIGESGSGKTSISKIIVGLLKADGQILFKGMNILENPKKINGKIQMIFQSPYSSLNPKYKIKDIILEGVIYQKILKKEENIDEYLIDILNEVGLDKEVLNKYPHELSGGQRQRVGIARAVAVKPALIIADEILTALDALTQIQILELFQKLKKNKKISYLFISHDINVVKKISDRLLIIKDGEIIESGEAKKIFLNPSSEYTKKLIEISGINLLINKNN